MTIAIIFFVLLLVLVAGGLLNDEARRIGHE